MRQAYRETIAQLKTADTIRCLFVGLVIVSLVLVASGAGLLRDFELVLYNPRVNYANVFTPEPSSEIVHLDIDDKSIEQYGRWPWSRSLQADAINMLTDLGARTIALDVIYEQPEEPRWQLSPQGTNDGAESTFSQIDPDKILAEAIARHGRVITGVRNRQLKPQEIRELRRSSADGKHVAPGEEMVFVDVSETVDESRLLAAPPNRVQRVDPVARLRDASYTLGGVSFDERRAGGSIRDLRVEYPYVDRVRMFTLGVASAAVHLGIPFDQIEIDGNTLQVSDHATVPLTPDGYMLVPWMPRSHLESAPWIARELRDTGEEARRRATIELAAVWSWRDGERLEITSLVDKPAFQEQLRQLWQTNGITPDQIEQSARAEWIARRPWERVHRHIPMKELIELWQAERNNHSTQFEAAKVIHTVYYPDGEFAPTDQFEPLPQELVAQIDEAIEVAFGYEPYSDLTTPELISTLEAEHRQGVNELRQRLADGEPVEQYEVDELRFVDATAAWLKVRQQLGPGGRITRRIAELREIFEGKLVFVGINQTASAVDTKPSPLGELTPGVVAHAAVANGLLTEPRHLLREAPRAGAFATALILGMVSAAAATLINPKRSWVALILIAGGVTLVNFYVFFDLLNTLVDLATPLTAIAAPFLGCTSYRAIQFRRERAALRAQFAARVSPQLVDILVDNPQMMNMAGESKKITTIFTDFAGFTAVSESLSDQEIVGIINLYLRALADELMEEGAYINKFLGDGIMAFWGAPHSTGEDETAGLRAALKLFEAMDRINDEQEAKGFKRLGMRVGMSTGEVIVGDCGAPPRLNDYTVIGDAVNLAARLESASKQFGVHMLITQETLEAADPELVKTMLWRPMGRIRVVGQSQGQRIVDVIGRRTGTEEDAEYEQIIELTTKAVEHYQNKEYEESMDLWRELVLMPHGSAGALMYIEYIDELIKEEREDPTLPLRSK